MSALNDCVILAAIESMYIRFMLPVVIGNSIICLILCIIEHSARKDASFEINEYLVHVINAKVEASENFRMFVVAVPRLQRTVPQQLGSHVAHSNTFSLDGRSILLCFLPHSPHALSLKLYHSVCFSFPSPCFLHQRSILFYSISKNLLIFYLDLLKMG